MQLLVGIPAPDATLCWGLQQTSSDDNWLKLDSRFLGVFLWNKRDLCLFLSFNVSFLTSSCQRLSLQCCSCMPASEFSHFHLEDLQKKNKQKKTFSSKNRLKMLCQSDLEAELGIWGSWKGSWAPSYRLCSPGADTGTHLIIQTPAKHQKEIEAVFLFFFFLAVLHSARYLPTEEWPITSPESSAAVCRPWPLNEFSYLFPWC